MLALSLFFELAIACLLEFFVGFYQRRYCVFQ